MKTMTTNLHSDPREQAEAVARWCGVSIPSEEEARCTVAMRMVRCAGPVFTLDDGREVAIPPGESLPQPQYTSDWNARYWLYLSQVLGDEITEASKAYFRPPPPYAESIDAMREVEDEIERRGLLRRYREELDSMWRADDMGMDRAEYLIRLTALQRLQAAARVIQEVGNA